jgi:hypothetical protein
MDRQLLEDAPTLAVFGVGNVDERLTCVGQRLMKE